MSDIDRQRLHAAMANLERLCTHATELCAKLSRERLALHLERADDRGHPRRRKSAKTGASTRAVKKR